MVVGVLRPFNEASMQMGRIACFKYLMRGAKPSFAWEDEFHGDAVGRNGNASGMRDVSRSYC